MKRLLIGICSCRGRAENRRAVRETSFSADFSEVRVEFFAGLGALEDREDDVTMVAAPDDDPPAKLQAWCRCALKYHDFDWLFVCDDGTYVVVDRLLQLIRRGEGKRMARNLPGRLLSRSEVEAVVQGCDVRSWEACETGIFSSAGATWLPRPENNGVATGWLSPEGMRAVHVIATREVAGRVDLEAGECCGRFHFYEEGVFVRSPEDEFGVWDIDGEANLTLDFLSGRDGRIVVSAAPLLVDEESPRLKIGVLIIATGRYRGFVHPLVTSIRKNFLPGHERRMFLFTDADQVPDDDVRVIRVMNRPWPGMTLFRHALFCEHAALFADMDHLFYLDADMRVDGPVGEEILSAGLTAVRHPANDGHLNPGDFPYDRNPDSTANVAPGEGESYFCGGVQGGTRECYLEAARSIARNVEEDSRRGATALWHDESHWNRYLIDRPPEKVLSSSYCRPEGWCGLLPRKITALEKDHTACRDQASVWPEAIIVALDCGLGNQMFQYAHGLALARHFGAAVEVRYEAWGGERFELGGYGVAMSVLRTIDEGMVEERGGYLPSMEERLREAVLATGKARVVVKGYFQNERLFAEVAEVVRQRFRLKPADCVSPEGATPVCIQIRRGNYVGSAKFDLCGERYFRDAMKLIRTFVARPHFQVVSDDLPWCRWFFAGMEDVSVPASQSQEEGLRTMAGCEAFVISNSTYGWWGAWLSEAKLVIAPDPWLGDQDWNVVPERWIRIPAKGITAFPEESSPAVSCGSSPSPALANEERPVRLYALCDKRPDFIGLQVGSLQRYLGDSDWQLIVVNNASSTELDRRIRDECRNHGLSMIEAAKDHSHPIKACHVPLDHLMRHEIRHRRNCLSVVIDSDLFLYRPFSFHRCLGGRTLAGIFQQRHGVAFPYFWNALLILDNDAIPDWDLLDFSPRRGSDVGGGTHGIFHAGWDFKLLSHTPDIRSPELAAATFTEAAGYHTDFGVQIIENAFLHYYRGSNWDRREEDHHREKTAFLQRVLADPALVAELREAPFDYGPFAHSSSRYNGDDAARRDLAASLGMLPPAVVWAVMARPGIG